MSKKFAEHSKNVAEQNTSSFDLVPANLRWHNKIIVFHCLFHLFRSFHLFHLNETSENLSGFQKTETSTKLQTQPDADVKSITQRTLNLFCLGTEAALACSALQRCMKVTCLKQVRFLPFVEVFRCPFFCNAVELTWTAVVA